MMRRIQKTLVKVKVMKYSKTNSEGILRTDAAVNNFYKGFNCSQSVALAYCDIFGVEPELMLLMSASFGGGFARLRETCGAVSGMAIIIGLATGMTDPDDQARKSYNYQVVQRAVKLFEEENGGTHICKEFLGLKKAEGTYVAEARTTEYYEKRPCPKLIRSAATVLETILEEI